ncbi:major facilitator superfamily domain-containing protein [Mycena alexandri]|uniref:Major facilitator superfamily domain-containing protein n=1 Tax=Mycena alexandri TaxID=1745969 RepID=A0AAD6RXW2_9AGAR|nr:major facilitator superfamily domain-containing protein [Mycena alexandri]
MSTEKEPEVPTAVEPLQYSADESTQPRTHGDKFRNTETAVDLPHNNMFLVMTGLATTVFLASLDNTIVTTALPTITEHLHGTASDYSWTGVSYASSMLCSGASIPLWGKLSDVVGRKARRVYLSASLLGLLRSQAILYPCIALFLLGSGLCGAATSMSFLIGCRALQGIGGGGIIVMVQVVLSDIVLLLYERAFSQILGPLLGGILTERLSWRWIFWINAPTGGIATLLLMFCLNLNPTRKLTFKEFLQKFDFLGVLLLMSGTGTLLAGFSLAADNGWNSGSTIGLLVAGPVLLLLAGIVESRTTRMAVIPPRLFTTRTTLSLFGLAFFHAIGFMCTNFYLPVMFQGVNGDSPLISGVKMFPVALGGSVATVVIGPIVTATKRTRPFIWSGTALMTLGAGLLITLSEKSSLGQEMGFSLIQGLGTGFLFQPPLIALQAAMPLKDMAACTGAFYLVRYDQLSSVRPTLIPLSTLGSTLGVSLGGVAFQSQLAIRLRAIPALAGTSAEASILQGNYKDIKLILPVELRQQVIVALSRSLRTIYIMLAPLAGTTFLLSLLVRHYSLERNFVQKTRPSEEAVPQIEADEKGGEVAETK